MYMIPGSTPPPPPPPPPPPASASNSSSLQGAAGEEDDQVKDETAAAKQPLMPEDGYQWKKYGQKPIKNINMIRSYYKCRSKHCKVKKRVEWLPTNPSNQRTIYDGNHHNHTPPTPPPSHVNSNHQLQQQAANNSLQYELGNQVFGRHSK